MKIILREAASELALKGASLGVRGQYSLVPVSGSILQANGFYYLAGDFRCVLGDDVFLCVLNTVNHDIVAFGLDTPYGRVCVEDVWGQCLYAVAGN